MTDVPVTETAAPVTEAKPSDGPRSTDPKDKVEAEAKPEADAGQGSEEEEEETPETEVETPETPAQPKKKKGLQSRLNELTAEKYALKAENEARDKRILELQEQLKAAPVTAEPGTVKSLEDFDFDQAAYLRYLAKEEAKGIIEAQKATERQEQEQVKQQEKNKKWQDRQAAYAADRPDYQATAYNNPLAQFYPKDLIDFVIESDVGPQLAYHLGQNLTDTDALIRMEPRERDRALSRIEAKLEAKPTAQPRTFTQAPAPVKSLGGSGQVEKSPDDMTMPEYNAWRKRQISAKR